MAVTARKLIVEVVEARNLLPKDGTGTSSPYVLVDFDGQLRKTQTVRRDLNPVWNEVLELNVNGPFDAAGDPMEVSVYHDRKVGPSRRNNFLGRVRLDFRQFVRKGEEALIYYPLEKKSFFSWIRGDIGLKIYYVDEPIPEPAPAPPEVAGEGGDQPSQATPPAEDAAPATQQTEEAPSADHADSGNPGDAPVPPGPETEPAPPPTAGAPESEDAPPPPAAEVDADADPTSPEPPEENSTEPPELDPPPPPESGTQAPPPPSEPEKAASPKWVAPPPRQMLRTPEREVVERSAYDLVDKMQYLFVRIVRAQALPARAKPHVRVSAFGRHVSTRPARRGAFFEWDQTFAFPRDATTAGDSSALELSVWDLPPPDSGDNDAAVTAYDEEDDKHFLGVVCFDVSEVPTRDPPDSPLATSWYRLKGGGGHRGYRGAGYLMLATWIGTQADESFPAAWKADTPPGHVSSRSKVYLSPKLWYLRATIIEAQDSLTPLPANSTISVRATLGFQVLKTRSAVNRNGGPSWNEDLLFVAAEPFDEDERLLLSLEIRHGKETAVLGSAGIPLSSVERRVDDRKVASRWLDLVPAGGGEEGKKGWGRRHVTGGRLHVRACLDGGYHVTDEPAHAASDFRPAARQLWQPAVGAVELGIIGCKGLLPMRTVEGKGSTDAFAVAKYGPKWARTRTMADSFEPAWNEQYTWPVHDPCTVITVAVFDESKDSTCRPMGKIRIRISTLETERVYRGSYPLILLLPSGPKRMGEIEVAVRFSRARSLLELVHLYSQPTLPAMHYLRPVPMLQRESLRLAAARLVAGHLSRSEPALRREVVLWTLDATETRGFSMRRIRANWTRIVAALSWVTDVVRWTEDIRSWRTPTTTILAHAVMVLLIWYPDLVGPAVAFHFFAVGVWRYRRRVRDPLPYPCIKASGLEVVEREELDEEFDTVPSGKAPEVVRARYDRARAVGTRVATVLGDVAAQAERLRALVGWRDPRATGVFVGMCLLVAVVLFVVPARIVAVAAGFYFLRHPMFRDRMPPTAVNFFRRLPSLSDRVI